jgi:hypothetical protein
LIACVTQNNEKDPDWNPQYPRQHGSELIQAFSAPHAGKVVLAVRDAGNINMVFPNLLKSSSRLIVSVTLTGFPTGSTFLRPLYGVQVFFNAEVFLKTNFWFSVSDGFHKNSSFPKSWETLAQQKPPGHSNIGYVSY